jgi:protein tyrosine/serine phosphatase
MDDRLLPFEAIENFRDYGGYAVGGRRLKRGRLFRSGHHHRASEADLERLGALNLAAVVDLRRASERREQPSRRAAAFSGAVIEGDDGEVAEAPHIAFLRSTDLTEDSVRGFMLETYRTMAFDARHLDVFARYFRTLAEDDRPVVIHCAAGKDRTGLLAALTHHALGVTRDDLLEDYLLTNTAVRLQERAPEIGRRIQETYGRPASDEAVIAFLGVEPAYLEAAFAEIERRHGSLDRYLEDALGLDAETRARLADRLVD